MDPLAVADALALFCTPDARIITGAEIAIDQAFTAGRMPVNARMLGIAAALQ